MKKQTVIVTGASSGIGLEIARYFLEKGDNVIINSQTESKLKEVFNELGAGENLAMVAGNVSDKTTGEQLVKTALEKFGSWISLSITPESMKTKLFWRLQKIIWIGF